MRLTCNWRGSAYQDWQLDQLGNWTEFTGQERTHNAANEILTVEGQSAPTYDDAGNMTFDGTWSYVYDAWNRLVGADDGVTEVAYEYDGRNYRIAKTVGEVVTDYYYNDSWQVLEERVAGTPSVQNVWDQRYVDAPIVCFRDANADFGQIGSDGLEEPLYYTNDANMNVTALVTAAGAVAERYAYDSYGTAAVLDGTTGGQTDWATDADGLSDVANELLYCGYRYNPETGNYHVRNREYQASAAGSRETRRGM